MDETILEQTYQENLEERLITCLAEMNHFSLEKAMDIYYHSKLADKIHQGTEGIQCFRLNPPRRGTVKN